MRPEICVPGPGVKGAAPAGRSNRSIRNRMVVVADDTAFVRDRFSTALQRAGHQTMTVGTGPELLGKLRQEGRIDLIVLDLRLPQGHGLALLRAMKKLERQPPTIVVFSGTIANADEVRQLASLGVAGYVNEYTALQHILPSLAPHLFPENHNRRSSPRAVLGVPVSYRFGNTIAAALTLNISQGGFAIRTTSPLPVGTFVKARFRLPGGKSEILADARVAWLDQRVGMGLQFTKIEGAAQAEVDQFIESRFFSNRKA
jgi:uncharacterized protein (TIGR02266 family)